VTEEQSFRRSFDSLEEIFEFTSGFFAAHGIDRGLLPTVDLALEELFTNMVKYSPAGNALIRIEMATTPGGVEVTLTEYDRGAPARGSRAASHPAARGLAAL
jgi:anti-sigma regulatory factor (Ser/Thr protein kinase)